MVAEPQLFPEGKYVFPVMVAYPWELSRMGIPYYRLRFLQEGAPVLTLARHPRYDMYKLQWAMRHGLWYPESYPPHDPSWLEGLEMRVQVIHEQPFKNRDPEDLRTFASIRRFDLVDTKPPVYKSNRLW